MPTYVYGCDTCNHRFEQQQKFQDAPLQTCPECGARIRRIFQPAGIVFKGSGWYSTDSRAARNGNGNGTNKEAADGKAADGKATAGDTPAKKEGDAAKSDTAKADTAPTGAAAPAKASAGAE